MPKDIRRVKAIKVGPVRAILTDEDQRVIMAIRFGLVTRGVGQYRGTQHTEWHVADRDITNLVKRLERIGVVRINEWSWGHMRGRSNLGLLPYEEGTD